MFWMRAYLTSILWISKNAELNDDFKSVEKSVKKFIQKSY